MSNKIRNINLKNIIKTKLVHRRIYNWFSGAVAPWPWKGTMILACINAHGIP